LAAASESGNLIARWDEALRIGHKDASLTMRLYAHSQDEALKAAHKIWFAAIPDGRNRSAI
jgi:hypothetical protein